MEEQQQQIESYVKANLQDEVAREMKRADALAKLVIDFQQNNKGEELANVHTSQGFQSVWDYRGGEKTKFRLDRKKDQVSQNYDARTHLFQKLFYAKDLLLADERELRTAYFSAETNYNVMRQAG